MSNEIIYPNYNKSILSTITLILKHYKVYTRYKSLESLDNILQKNYKNVVFLILDGMGEYVYKPISPTGFLSNHQIDIVTSVFPATTTAATTTYYSGRPPYETGWVAWSQYFKEYGRAFDMLSRKESYRKDIYSSEELEVLENIMKYEAIYSQIEKSSPEVEAYEVEPEYANVLSKRKIIANNFEEITEKVYELCKKHTKKFILAYLDEPDNLLHINGTKSEIVKEFILDIEGKIKKNLFYYQKKNC